MYTGELFYETREDIEHLAMIEKQCGPIPDWMASGSLNHQMRSIFLRDGQTKIVENYRMHINWPEAKRKSYQSWLKMKTLSHLVQHQYNKFHKSFLDLLEFMMIIDPSHRPSARDCLNHDFFKLEIPDTD